MRPESLTSIETQNLLMNKIDGKKVGASSIIVEVLCLVTVELVMS